VGGADEVGAPVCGGGVLDAWLSDGGAGERLGVGAAVVGGVPDLLEGGPG
jgi:hypothetical protein